MSREEREKQWQKVEQAITKLNDKSDLHRPDPKIDELIKEYDRLESETPGSKDSERGARPRFFSRYCSNRTTSRSIGVTGRGGGMGTTPLDRRRSSRALKTWVRQMRSLGQLRAAIFDEGIELTVVKISELNLLFDEPLVEKPDYPHSVAGPEFAVALCQQQTRKLVDIGRQGSRAQVVNGLRTDVNLLKHKEISYWPELAGGEI